MTSGYCLLEPRQHAVFGADVIIIITYWYKYVMEAGYFTG